MTHHRLPLAAAISACLCVAAPTWAADKSGHKFNGSAELEFRTNDNITVAPSSSDSFDFADFGDFAEAEAKDEEGEDEDEDEGDDEEGDEDFGDDDFDDIGLDDTDLSEDEFELAVDDDDGDGSEDDSDGDGIDDDEDPDPEDPDPDGKRDDSQLDDLIDDQVADKAVGRRQSQNRWTAKLGFGHKFAFGNGVTWGSSMKVAGDFHNGKDSLDKSNFAFSTGPEFKLKDLGLKIKPALSYVFIRQNGNKIVGTLVGTLAAGYEINKKWDVDAVYNYQDRDITDPDSPDAIINTFTVGGQFTATKKDIFKFRYSPKVEDSSQVTKNKDTDGWQITYSRKLPWDTILGIGAKDDSVDFVNLPNGRSDDVRAYSIDLAHQFNKSFEMGLSYETRDLDSNIDAKDAKNKSFLISGTWKF